MPPKPTDLTGQRFVKLTVLYREGFNGNGQGMWRCLCDCGTYTHATTGHLRSNGVQTCGCGQYAPKNIVGLRFGNLIVVGAAGRTRAGWCWLARCDCGNYCIKGGAKLRFGQARRCSRKCPTQRNLCGQRFGRLLIIGLAPRGLRRPRRFDWLALCDCGSLCVVQPRLLRRVQTRSCGCLQKEMASQALQPYRLQGPRSRWYPLATKAEYDDLMKAKKLLKEFTIDVRQQRNEHQRIAS